MAPHVSMRVGDQVKGGGLFGDADGVVVAARVDDFAYGGTGATGVGVILDIAPAEGGDHIEQFWSAGDKLQPSPDKKRLEGTAGATGLSETSNLGLFLGSLVNCGYPDNRLPGPEDSDPDITVLVGLEAHWIRVAQPERSGLKKVKKDGEVKKDGPDRAPTYLQVSKIHKMPWEGKSSRAGAEASASAAPDAGNGVDMDAAILVNKLLTMHGKSMAKNELMRKAFEFIVKDAELKPKIQKILNALDNDSVLKNLPGVKYSGGVLSL